MTYMRSSYWRVISLLCLCVIFLSSSAFSMDDDWYGPRSIGAEESAKWNEKMLAAYGDNEKFLVLPGVVADQDAARVTLLVEATGLPAGDTPEFIIVDSASSHGYESIFWSMAKPSDVGKALEFIGLESGGSINPAALRFWAQGDPVSISLELPGETIALENTIFDLETGEALVEEGFVFTGSLPVTLPNTGNKVHYAADVYDPRSIVPLYNEPSSVLDIPRQAHQGEVYGRYAVNPDYAFEHGQIFTVTMGSTATNGRPARLRYRLALTNTNETYDLLFTLVDEKVDSIVKVSQELTPVLERMVEKSSERQVPIVTLDFDPDVRLAGLSRLCRLVAVMETFNQARVAPPLEGQLYYRAFVPSPEWKEPAGRPVQPWELHLVQEGDGIRAALVLHEMKEEGTRETTFSRQSHAVENPADVQRIIYRDAVLRDIEQRMQLPAVVLVFADEALAYARLMEYLDPILETHGTVYVFVNDEETE